MKKANTSEYEASSVGWKQHFPGGAGRAGWMLWTALHGVCPGPGHPPECFFPSPSSSPPSIHTVASQVLSCITRTLTPAPKFRWSLERWLDPRSGTQGAYSGDPMASNHSHLLHIMSPNEVIQKATNLPYQACVCFKCSHCVQLFFSPIFILSVSWFQVSISPSKCYYSSGNSTSNVHANLSHHCIWT